MLTENWMHFSKKKTKQNRKLMLWLIIFVKKINKRAKLYQMQVQNVTLRSTVLSGKHNLSFFFWGGGSSSSFSCPRSPGDRRPVRWFWCSPTTPSWPTTPGCWWRATSCSPWWAAPSSHWRSTSPGTSPWAGVRKETAHWRPDVDVKQRIVWFLFFFAGVPLVVIAFWGCAKYFFEDEG